MINDFIAEFPNAFEQEFCQTAIDYYESQSARGFGYSRQIERPGTSKLERDNSTVYFSDTTGYDIAYSGKLPQYVIERITNVYFPAYIDQYSILETAAKCSIYQMKIQKISPGQGYHLWHYESNNRQVSNRLLNYQLYLNDVDQGGETEFLYYGKRVPATCGTLLLYPCNFTHAHRGNPPLAGTKYLLNGWIEY
jgi:2OG-Fe(II) oxygenase superfamily